MALTQLKKVNKDVYVYDADTWADTASLVYRIIHNSSDSSPNVAIRLTPHSYRITYSLTKSKE